MCEVLPEGEDLHRENEEEAAVFIWDTGRG